MRLVLAGSRQVLGEQTGGCGGATERGLGVHGAASSAAAQQVVVRAGHAFIAKASGLPSTVLPIGNIRPAVGLHSETVMVADAAAW